MASDSNPIRENDTADDGSYKSAEKRDTAKQELPITATPVQANGQKTPSHCEITYKTEKSTWERIKPYIEFAGVLLVALYTLYTIKMYNVTRKALIAANAAVFSCQAQLPGGVNGFVVECRNQGSAPATEISANLSFARDEQGKQVQLVSRTLTRAAVVKGDEFAFIVPVGAPNPPNWDWVSTQSITANVIFSYNNGIETIHERDCWALVIEKQERAWTVTDCENASAINKAENQK